MVSVIDRPVAARRSRREQAPTLLVAGVLVLAYFLASLGSSPDAYLSTDTGGKVATLDAMIEARSWEPDLGYWAEEFDPSGSLYPMYGTSRIGDQWVNVTTLPMIYLARPLYGLGGYRLALLVPMAAAAAAALLAAKLAQRLGAVDQRSAWIVGLASPVAIYALDFWEHSLGVALMLGAVNLATDVIESRRQVMAALLAGVCFGLAFSMRQEALVYGFVTGVVVVVEVGRRRGMRAAMLRGAYMVVGLGIAVVGNSALERLIYGATIRTERSSAALSVGGGEISTRATEAVVTAASPFSSTDMPSVLMGLLLAVALLWLGVASLRSQSVRNPAILVAVLYVILAMDLVVGGLRFVPGLLATCPVAGLGVAVGLMRQRLRPIAAIALASLPLVWSVQYLGGATPQWGGRYLLVSMVLLVVLAVVGFEADPKVLWSLAAVGAAMTMIGVSWLSVRTHDVAAATSTIAELPAPVVVFSDPFVAREAGPLATQAQWLAAPSSETRAKVVEVLRAAGITEFVFVDLQDRDAGALFDGYRAGDASDLDFLGTTLTVTSLAAAP